MPLVLTRRLKPLHGLIDMVPAITVVLLLLLFFLLSSSFVLQPGIKVNLPKMAFWEGTPSSRLVVAVTMSPLQTDVNGIPLPQHPVMYFNDQIVTLETLGKQLAALPVGRESRTLVVKADRNVPLNVVTDITDAAFAHRLNPVIATQP